MAGQGSGSNTTMALIVGGLVVAVGFVLYFVFGDQIAGTGVTDGGTTVNVETSAEGGGTGTADEGAASEGGSGEGASDEGTTSTDGATEGGSGN